MERKILGVRVDNLSLVGVAKEIEDLVEEGGFHLVVTMNPEILMQARKDKEFLKIVNEKTVIVTADGAGIILAGKLLEKPFKEKITGNDLIEPLVQLCLAKKWPIMLMGGGPGVTQKALENLKAKHPNLSGIATSHPLKPILEEISFLAKSIHKVRPAIVFVAMNFGEREKFILQLIQVLKKNDFRRGIVFVGIGGAMDYLAGTVKRAPRIFQKLGLEWFWRLFTEPRKRLIRQLRSLPVFAFLVLKETVHCQR